MSIDPTVLAAVAGMPPTDPGPSSHTPAERRVAAEAGIDAFVRSLPRDPRWDAVDIDNLIVPGEGRDIPVRIFRPQGSTAVLPAVLYFFGGAFWMRSYDSEDMQSLCRRLAVEADAVVVEIDYALAPEHPYPAALDDGMTVLRWMAEQGAALGFDVERLAIGGLSSGGGIAAGLALRARDAGGPVIRLQILEVPAVDLGLSLVETPPAGASEAELAGLVEFQNFYLPDGKPQGDPYVVPSDTPSVEGLPPTMILSAELDVLVPSGNAYADRLRDAGVPCVSIVFGGQVHFSPGLPSVSPTSRAWRATVAEAVRGLHRDPLNPL